METPENKSPERGVAPAYRTRRRDTAARRPSQAARHPAVTIGSGIFTFLLFALLGGGLALWYGEHAYNGPGPLAEEKTVLIPRGAGVRDMAETLEREGVIDNWLVFIVGQKMMRPDASMKAGEYLFKPGQSMASVVEAIASGKVVVHQVTIPEGLTSQQVVQRLMANDLLTGTPVVPLEGTLLPETYRIHRGMSRDELLKQMADAQQKLVKALWDKRAPDLPLKNTQELIILASIVEKETGEPDERAKVAAVFVNRLNKKMRLQSDPTIIYGLVGGKGSLGRPITRADIVSPTAYNTYAVDGLPPGPIANPGRDALAAVANPARTKDLYFVADGTGGHAFAETLVDHNKNVARWRALEAAQPGAAPQPAAPAPASPAASPQNGAPAPAAN
ncbi:endolytic transglycosylase MltG [Xanthobacter sediminis]